MAYLPAADEKLWCWYVSIERHGDWKVTHWNGIQQYETRLFERRTEMGAAN
jgi:hypothetical protein